MKRRSNVRWLVVVPLVLMALAVAPLASAQENGQGMGNLEAAAHLARSQRIGEIQGDRAAFVNEMLAKFAEPAAAKGYDAYWQKGQRNLLTRSAAELLTLSERATDFDTFDKLVFQGYTVNDLGDLTQDLVFFPVAPCRLLDSRIGTGTFAGPKAPGTEIQFSVNDTLTPQGGLPAGCGIPTADPPALAVVVTAVPTDTGQGNLRTYPTLGTIPTASLVNYQNGVVVASGAITQSCTACGYELTVRNQGAGTTHIVVDVTGYFTRASFGATPGTVWAAAHITGGATPSVTRSFNNIPGSTGTTVARSSAGTYQVRFGANIESRFYNVVLGNASSGIPTAGYATVTPEAADLTGLYIKLYDSSGAAVDTNFFVQVF